jgi:Flp pilus assembly protein TadD
MKTKRFIAAVAAAGFLLALTALPAVAFAQQGGLMGKVVGPDGQPVADAEILVNNPTNVGGYKYKTNAKGEYVGVGIPSGDYQIKATKGNMTGMIPRIQIGRGATTPMPTITLQAGGSGRGAAPTAASAEEAEKINKQRAEMLVKFKDAQAMADAGNFDAALTAFNAVAATMPDCDLCYLQIGQVNLKKKDEAAAEKAYLKAIEINPENAAPYAALASIYNGQKKFDEANKMGSKATELMAASGGGDPQAYVNQGIIFWNQSKTPEAKAQFQKAAQLDPKNADAHYWLGMALVNEGAAADAVTHMKEYLALAPTGQYADTAKAILDSLK